MSRNTIERRLFGIGAMVGLRAVGLVAMLGSLALAGDRRHRSQALIPRDVFEGKELFEKSWEPGEPSPAGGDGLGPLYNETSCVGCHHLGGTGGGGGDERNVVMLTAIASPDVAVQGETVFQGRLEVLHPGFQNHASIVLHRHATSPEADQRLGKIASFTAVQNREQFFTLRQGRRNTPALFGAGLVDAISDTVLRQAEKQSFPNFPEIHGRVSELPDGRLGRFGWKAQIASLGDFVRAACSNELGLEVPGHHQVSLAPAGALDTATPMLDMDEAQCKLLTGFVARLAPPLRWVPGNGRLSPWGYMVFESIGCATCHAPNWATSADFTATCCCTTWVNHQVIPPSTTVLRSRRVARITWRQARSPRGQPAWRQRPSGARPRYGAWRIRRLTCMTAGPARSTTRFACMPVRPPSRPPGTAGWPRATARPCSLSSARSPSRASQSPGSRPRLRPSGRPARFDGGVAFGEAQVEDWILGGVAVTILTPLILAVVIKPGRWTAVLSIAGLLGRVGFGIWLAMMATC